MANRSVARFLYSETEFCCESDDPKHSDWIFAVPSSRVAYDSNKPLSDVFYSIEVVKDKFIDWIQVERVDGEIASRRILVKRSVDIIAK